MTVKETIKKLDEYEKQYDAAWKKKGADLPDIYMEAGKAASEGVSLAKKVLKQIPEMKKTLAKKRNEAEKKYGKDSKKYWDAESKVNDIEFLESAANFAILKLDHPIY